GAEIGSPGAWRPLVMKLVLAVGHHDDDLVHLRIVIIDRQIRRRLGPQAPPARRHRPPRPGEPEAAQRAAAMPGLELVDGRRKNRLRLYERRDGRPTTEIRTGAGVLSLVPVLDRRPNIVRVAGIKEAGEGGFRRRRIGTILPASPRHHAAFP